MDVKINLDLENLFNSEIAEEEKEFNKGRKFIKKFEKNLTKIVEHRLNGNTGDC